MSSRSYLFRSLILRLYSGLYPAVSSQITAVQKPQFTTMSWMDSWSRPAKHSAIPPPFYLTSGEDVPYCHTCGRVMTTRKSHKKSDNVVKYCSDRCRSRKPGPIDKKIEQTILSLLDGQPDSGLEKTGAKERVVKGDKRIIVTCDEIEEIVFGSRFDPEKVYGRRKNRASRVIGGKDKEWKSVDMESDSESSDDQHGVQLVQNPTSTHVRPPQTEAEVNFSIGGERGWAEKVEETPAELEKRLQGQKRADEREMVRRAARRAVVFGFEVQTPEPDVDRSSKRSRRASNEHSSTEPPAVSTKKKCEALMNGSVVEPSFAKGNWSIRWRES